MWNIVIKNVRHNPISIQVELLYEMILKRHKTIKHLNKNLCRETEKNPHLYTSEEE